MTAEEFLMKNPNQYLGMTPVEFAEAYHKHRVEGITDEDINKQFELKIEISSLNYEINGRRDGAKWFKNKLLKQ